MALSVLSGCSIFSHGRSGTLNPVPSSNRLTAETVIRRAFDDLGIPDGAGTEISWEVMGTGPACDYARIIAPEFLIERGFILTMKGDSVPDIRFTVDTLYVSLTKERTEEREKRMLRSAGAGIEAVFSGGAGTKKVYCGRGVFQDYFPVSMMDAVGTEEPYVVIDDSFLSILKPALYSVAVTVFLWYLYSFRG